MRAVKMHNAAHTYLLRFKKTVKEQTCAYVDIKAPPLPLLRRKPASTFCLNSSQNALFHNAYLRPSAAEFRNNLMQPQPLTPFQLADTL